MSLSLNDRRTDDIDEILKKISSGSHPKEGEIEFEIGVEAMAPEKELSSAIEFTEEPDSAPKEEDFVPDIFAIAEKEEGGRISDDIFKIQTVYVPRFTEASDDFNRLGFIPEKPKKNPESVKEQSTHIDAVAELDTVPTPDAKLVDTAKAEALIDETSTVFKFETEPEPAVEQISKEELENEEPAPDAELYEEPLADETAPAAEAASFEVNASEAASAAEESPSEKKAPEAVPVAEKPAPEPPKPRERYIPTAPSKRENIQSVGDELAEYSKNEYNSASKRDSFKDKFLDMLMSQRVRFFVSLAVMLLLLVFENISLFGVNLIDLFDFHTYPHALALIDLQCVICLLLLASPELLRAVRSFGKRQYTAELFAFPALLVYLIYSIVIFILKPLEYPLFGSVAAFYALFAIASAYARTNADFMAFKKISNDNIKCAVDNKYTRILEKENMALDGFVEEYKSKTARVFKTHFIADFFHRTKRSAESAPHMLLLLLPPLGVSLLSGLVSYLIYRESLSFVTAFALVFLFALPAFSLLVHKLPHLYSAVKADAENGALIGEAALYDYAGVDVISFEDTEIFGTEDVNLQRIVLFVNQENLTKALRQMSALFLNVGGPLSSIFNASLDRIPAPANGVTVYNDGITGEIDGNKVMAGSYAFMVSEGALVPPDEESTKKSLDSTKIMYAAENGTVYAKFYIRYRFSEEFTELMPTLKDEGIIPIVYTRDPNVSNELLKSLTAGVGVIRVLKKQTLPAGDFAPSKISCGMVFGGDKSNLLNLILLSKQYVRFNSQMKLAERSAMIAGLALGVLISMLGMMTRLPSVLPVLWHSAWCITLAVLSRRFFKLPKKEKKKDKKSNAKR